MIHATPSMIAKGNCCLFHDDMGWAELAYIDAVFFQKLEFKVCHLVIQAKFEPFLIFFF